MVSTAASLDFSGVTVVRVDVRAVFKGGFDDVLQRHNVSLCEMFRGTLVGIFGQYVHLK